jgi:acetyl esterase
MSDYGRRNNSIASQKLSGHFEYAGVLAFAGAVLTFDWGLKYPIPPAPTLLIQGTEDKLVPYDKIRFLNKGFYGCSWIAKTFKEKNYPYYIYRHVGMGHEESVLPMFNQLPLILDFLKTYVLDHKPYQTDISFKDPDAKPLMLLTPEELFKKLQSGQAPRLAK